MLQAGEPLKNHPWVRTRDPDELFQCLAPVYSVKRVDMPRGGRDFDVRLNHCRLPSLGITYARYNAPIEMQIVLADCFVQGFPLGGGGRASWNRRDMTLGADRVGVAGGPGHAGSFEYAGGFEHFAIRIAPAALTRIVAGLTGRPVVPPLALLTPVLSDPAQDRNLLRLVEFLAGELDQGHGQLPPIVIAELEQAILMGYLHAHEHNYSRWLREAQRPAAPWQAKRVADYIEAHWDEAVTIDTLIDVSNTSARSLFDMFRKTYGVSPMVYVRTVRLRRARDLLASPGPGTSVTSVSFRCGFSNLGRFSRDYQEAFGELPSETLRAASPPS